MIIGAMIGSLVYAGRAEKPQFKGVELYSFTVGQDETIRYALVPGTNALKQASYLIEKAINYNELIEKIKSLAQKENIYWFNRLPKETLDKAVTFKYPIKTTIEEIITLCKELDITLDIDYENK